LYGDWATLVNSDTQVAFHGMLRSVLWIVLALLSLVAAEGMIENLYAGTVPGRRAGAVPLVLRHITQVIGVLVILLVLLGVPKQLSTILAVAGAATAFV
jgi:hypothetical protein